MSEISPSSIGSLANATTLSIEALFLFSSNKTGAWSERKTPEEKEALFRKGCRLAPEFKELYKQRRKELLEDRAKVLRAKQLAVQRLLEKRVIEKEKLTEAIMVYGLWQNETQIRDALKENWQPLLKSSRL